MQSFVHNSKTFIYDECYTKTQSVFKTPFELMWIKVQLWDSLQAINEPTRSLLCFYLSNVRSPFNTHIVCMKFAWTCVKNVVFYEYQPFLWDSLIHNAWQALRWQCLWSQSFISYRHAKIPFMVLPFWKWVLPVLSNSCHHTCNSKFRGQ